MDLFKIYTNAWEDEDFFLQTDLSKEQIKKVIAPIVLLERLKLQDEEDLSKPIHLINALIEAYPDAIVEQYIIDDYETISI